MNMKQAQKLIVALCVASAACLIVSITTNKLLFNILGILLVVAAGWAHTRFIRCPHCGKHLGKEDKGANCPYCGKRIEE